jgi:hypothetical protein
MFLNSDQLPIEGPVMIAESQKSNHYRYHGKGDSVSLIRLDE